MGIREPNTEEPLLLTGGQIDRLPAGSALEDRPLAGDEFHRRRDFEEHQAAVRTDDVVGQGVRMRGSSIGDRPTCSHGVRKGARDMNRSLGPVRDDLLERVGSEKGGSEVIHRRPFRHVSLLIPRSLFEAPDASGEGDVDDPALKGGLLRHGDG
jgi:hypothetical protein